MSEETEAIIVIGTCFLMLLVPLIMLIKAFRE